MPAAAAPTFKVGDAAPPIQVGKWLKVEAVGSDDPGRIHGVGFWVTNRAPWIQYAPHLSE